MNMFRAIIGEMGRVSIYYACAVPLESLYACAIVVDMGPEKSEIKLDFEISYALERRVGPLGLEVRVEVRDCAKFVKVVIEKKKKKNKMVKFRNFHTGLSRYCWGYF